MENALASQIDTLSLRSSQKREKSCIEPASGIIEHSNKDNNLLKTEIAVGTSMNAVLTLA
jgi:hypothetical protein